MVMPRIWTGWNHSRARAALIWVLCFAAFHFLVRMALHNSLQTPVPTPSYGGSSGISTDIPISNTERRFRLYDRMAKDLDEHGAVFLKHGETSQSLSLSELFALVDGAVKPVPKAANPPVRANVLYLSSKYSKPISYEGSTICLTPFRIMYGNYLDHILIKNSSLYHFSMFHASHHISPVPASEDEIEAEATAVRAVADTICPLKIVLDRVVLTSTGVLLGCWQVISGTDPISIRAKLRTALPHAPEKQLYDAAILHTSFARLLGPPKSTPNDLSTNSDQLKFFHELVAQLNKKLGGSEALVSELWYVEEYDVLALAVDGRMKVRRFQLGCTGA